MGAIHFSIDPDLLALLRDATGARRFVETGTFEGRSLQTAAGIFEECYSVDISEDYYRMAAEQFAGYPVVHLVHGSSASFLRANRRLFASTPTVFWLDAHWCAADHTSDITGQSPLLQEIEALGELHPSSTLLIDDARLYLAPPLHPHRISEWPDFHDVVVRLLALSAGHRLMVLNDVILLYPDVVAAALRSYGSKNGVDYQLQAMRTPELLPTNRHLALEETRHHAAYQELRRNSLAWFFNPLAWQARIQRNRIRREIGRLRA
jgi:hypothetical protein